MLLPQACHHRDVGASSLRQRHNRMVGENPWGWNSIGSSEQMRYQKSGKCSCSLSVLEASVRKGMQCANCEQRTLQTTKQRTRSDHVVGISSLRASPFRRNNTVGQWFNTNPWIGPIMMLQNGSVADHGVINYDGPPELEPRVGSPSHCHASLELLGIV